MVARYTGNRTAIYLKPFARSETDMNILVMQTAAFKAAEHVGILSRNELHWVCFSTSLVSPPSFTPTYEVINSTTRPGFL